MTNLVAANGQIDPESAVNGFIPKWRAGQDESEYWELALPITPTLSPRTKTVKDPSP